MIPGSSAHLTSSIRTRSVQDQHVLLEEGNLPLSSIDHQDQYSEHQQQQQHHGSIMQTASKHAKGNGSTAGARGDHVKAARPVRVESSPAHESMEQVAMTRLRRPNEHGSSNTTNGRSKNGEYEKRGGEEGYISTSTTAHGSGGGHGLHGRDRRAFMLLVMLCEYMLVHVGKRHF